MICFYILYADTLGVLCHKKSDFRGRSVSTSGSLEPVYASRLLRKLKGCARRRREWIFFFFFFSSPKGVGMGDVTARCGWYVRVGGTVQ